MQESDSHTSSDKAAIELVTVAVQYCSYLEQTEGIERTDFVDTVLKIASLLYLKALLTPPYVSVDEYYEPVDYVTEENYDIVRGNIAATLGEQDDYLDVFVEDMKYSESPILCTISENLADVYQEVKNFALNYRNAANAADTMNALAQMKDDFQYSWGQKLVNVMRALHEVHFDDQQQYDY